jgi:hypothetical protein
MNVTASNISGETYTINSAPFKAILDPKSIYLVYSTLKQTLSSAYANFSNFSTGFRVWSGIANNSTNLPPFLYNNNSYYNYPYDNSWDISNPNNTINASQELQIANGKFITKSSGIGYLNYNNYFYTNISKANSFNKNDYSGIQPTGYRYATFAWKISEPQINFVKGYGRLLIKLNNINNNIFINDSSVLYTNDNNNNSYKILLHYRFEDTTNKNLGIDSLSTTWISSNSSEYPLINTSNYYTTFTPFLCGINRPPIANEDSITFFSIIPNIIDITNYSKYVLYLRIGVPQEADFKFETISIKLE